MTEKSNIKNFCIVCEKEKQNKYCESCKKETNDLVKIAMAETLKARESIGIEKRRFGIKKYLKKFFQGYASSGDYKKYLALIKEERRKN